MDNVNVEKLLERLEAMEKKAQRADDYRQIMNAMAGHEYCYNAHDQQYEIDRFWTKTKSDSYYNGNTGPVGVETYYVNNTRRLREGQTKIINRVYNKDLEGDAKVGYRVLHVLGTPFIEIAGDGLTAQGVWMAFNVQCHVNEFGIPQPSVSVSKTCAEFCKEDGVWKIWRFRPCPGGFELDVNLKSTGLIAGEDEFEMKKMEFGKPNFTPEEAKLLNMRDLIGDFYLPGGSGYKPYVPNVVDPPLPAPYETHEDAVRLFIFKDEV